MRGTEPFWAGVENVPRLRATVRDGNSTKLVVFSGKEAPDGLRIQCFPWLAQGAGGGPVKPEGSPL
jgi:hypothetical protein